MRPVTVEGVITLKELVIRARVTTDTVRYRFRIGLIKSYGYGWFTTLFWVPLYNAVASRSGNRCSICGNE